jgi:hypothetical protein
VSTSETPVAEQRRPVSLPTLWFGFIGALTAYAAHLMVVTVFVPFACETGYVWVLHAITGGLAVVVVASGAVAYACWRRLGKATPGTSPRLGGPGILASLGIVLAPVFLGPLLLSWYAIFSIDPCLR